MPVLRCVDLLGEVDDGHVLLDGEVSTDAGVASLRPRPPDQAPSAPSCARMRRRIATDAAYVESIPK